MSSPQSAPERKRTLCAHGKINPAMCSYCQMGANAARAMVYVGIAALVLVAAVLALMWIVLRSTR